MGLIFLSLSFIARAENEYKKRVEKYKTTWQRLIPTHSKLQYAGSMGFLSIGPGWNYGKHNQWETDILVGFVPHYIANSKITLTLKQNFMPWNIPIKKNFSMEPFACGIYFNTVLDNDFWVKEPERYPHGYYNFSTRIRSNIYIGQRATYHLHPGERHFSKAITIFYELSSNDLYIISAWGNKYLKPKDYLHLSFGVKLQIL